MADVVIGIDPHKSSHTAVAVGLSEEQLGQPQVRACASQAGQLLAWAAEWPERAWAVEGADRLWAPRMSWVTPGWMSTRYVPWDCMAAWLEARPQAVGEPLVVRFMWEVARSGLGTACWC